MHPPVGEAGLVADLAAGQDPFLLLCGMLAVDGGREHLPQGLQGIKNAVQSAGADDGVTGLDEDGVGFGRKGSVMQEYESLELAGREGLG